ncbi:MAG: tRNA pseudouridine(38-40) synthase TruA [Candidatus Neomarinimicrobiota bacterium]|nr:MAG: tRNA pseudouridine(38-40) synthase TruA [Candidatus Neomarinimicrobiota bacterium]
MLRRFKIVIEYDGTNYFGWQKQKKGETIQELIERALLPLNGGRRVRITGAGRTDAGVHALGQVAHFDMETELDPGTIKIVINANTPKDIYVTRCEEVDKSFHARFSAKRRKYIYRIARRYSPFDRLFSWCPPYELDTEKLHECSKLVVGKREFVRCCRSTCKAKSKECVVFESFWKEGERFLEYHVSANRFLQSMVRMLVGTMIEVARGRYTVEDFKNLLENKTNEVQVLTAPAKGLFLKEIIY